VKCNLFFFVSILFLLLQKDSCAQQKIALSIQFLTPESNKKFIEPNYIKTFNDTAALIAETQNIIAQLWKEGYPTVTADSLTWKGLTANTIIYTGKRFDTYKILRLVYTEANITDKPFKIKQQVYTAKELSRLKEKIIQYYEQNSYPFASVQLDSIVTNDDGCTSNLNITLHQQINFDSIIIIGNVKLNNKYLERYMAIKPGQSYDERNVKNINNRLRELPFLNQNKPYKVIFTKEYTKLLLFLEKKKANKFDGFLGFLPNDKTGRINFTGQMNIKLLNTIAHGETVELEWRKLQALTQDLKLNIAYPYIFNLPFGIDYNLKLYRRDTTFIDVANNIGLQYLLSAGNFLKFFVSKRNINLINTSQYEFVTALPEFADISYTAYGVSLNLNNTDYKLNPRKGLKTIIQASAGGKEIKKNPAINLVAYDGIALNSQQYSLQGNLGYFIPLMKKSTILLDAKFAKVVGKNIFTNELFRIGGLVSLRGFDEESINASAYLIPTVEYRYLFDKNSALFLFANAAYYENVSRNYRIFDRPFGFGSGIFFETKAGIFSLTYALGKQFNNPILIRNGKIHFGLVSVF
jgi:outer membrane protein assembly factor BamA